MDHKRDNADSPKLRRKRRKMGYSEYTPKMNIAYQDCLNLLSESFLNGKAIELENEAKILTNPFPCCVLPNFIQPEEYLKELKHELSQLHFEQKVNDLYQFDQSQDLKQLSLPNITKFRNLLHGEVLEWMKMFTKLPLTDNISLSCTRYTCSDHLLCHDDELKGRRIAFIYYLVPEWYKEDGGSLDLFDTVNEYSNEVCESVIPKWNNFVFFEVSPVSFHCVSEVLTSKERLALSGWFYGPALKFERNKMEETMLFKQPQELDATEWINPVYLDGQTQLDIRETFENDSEILLPDFLQTKKYEEVCKALTDSAIDWNRKGPPTHNDIVFEISNIEYFQVFSDSFGPPLVITKGSYRNVYEACDDKIPAILKECQALFTSEAFFLILSNFTALNLHPVCEEGAKFGRVFSSIRKWCPGSYTLLHDQSFSKMYSLNTNMYFNCTDWSDDCGGYSSYIADDEDDELLRIEPSSNSLALVYTDKGTSHFVKYINCRAKERAVPFFHDIFSVYIENESKE